MPWCDWIIPNSPSLTSKSLHFLLSPHQNFHIIKKLAIANSLKFYSSLMYCRSHDGAGLQSHHAKTRNRCGKRLLSQSPASISPSFIDNTVLFGLCVKLTVKCGLGLLLEASSMSCTSPAVVGETKLFSHM